MNIRSLSRFAAVSASLVALALSASVASAATTSLPAATSACSTPVFTQPFATFNDTNWYSLMPGQTVDNFDAGGWTLSNGASIVTTTLADGATGSVLDLPSGAVAVSPIVCVTSDYPVARMDVRNLVGAEGVSFNVAYIGTPTETKPKNSGQVHGKQTAWTLSDPVNLQPAGNTADWQQMRLVLVGNGKTSHFQVYNIYLDPRCR